MSSALIPSPWAANKRLDEWVPQSRIVSADDAEAETVAASPIALEDKPGRKLTRGMKRKHEEMNHVQRVRCAHRFHHRTILTVW